MKNVKKILSLILTVCMVLSLLPVTVQADMAPYTISTGTVYPTLSETLANAPDGAIITFSENITESVTYAVYADKTITIDGGDFTLTGTSTALTLTGTGLVNLKNLTLQSNASSGTSTGLDVSDSVSVQSYGTVIANGSAATASSSYGVTNSGTGTVDVTEAVAAGLMSGCGAYNAGSGTINVGSATGSGAMNGVGAYNNAGGTINVTTATGSRDGVTNHGGGTINVTTAVSNDASFGSAITNINTGTVNAGAANGVIMGVQNINAGTINVGTVTGTTDTGSGIVNTGTDITVVPLHVGTGASCVLDSITIAKSGSTIGTLPNVYKGSDCSAKWYTGIALTNLFQMQEISGEATLYSDFYTIETAEDVATYINEIAGFSGLTTSVSGSTVSVTGTATLTSTSDAALTIDIPAGVTVVWKASLTGGGSKYLLELTGDGTFEVADGADIVNTACQAAIYCYDGKGNLNVTGGKVSTTVGSGVAIGIAGDWLLTMSDGEVSANAADSCAIFGKNSVVITGGTVSATGTGGLQLYMSETSVYRSSVLDPGKIMYHTSGIFADVSIDAAIMQVQPDTSTGLTTTKHNMSTGDSVTAVWAVQNGVSGVNISYYSEKTPKIAYKTGFFAVPGVTVTTTRTVTYNKNGGDTEASPATKTVASGENVGTLPSAPTRSGYTFAGWNTAADGSGAAFTATVIVKSDITVYAQWNKNSSTSTGGSSGSNSGDDSDHGSSSGGGGSTPTVTPPATQPTTQPTTPTVTASTGNTTPTVTSTTTATATSSANGSATAAVTTGQITDAVNKAAAQAGAGTAAQVEIKVAAPADATTIATSIPEAAMDTVANSTASFTVSTPIAAITFDNKALDTIAGAAAADVKISAAKVDAAALSQETKQVVGDRPVFNFSVTSGDKAISQFGGNVSVSVPYKPKAGEDTNAIVIYYINAEGRPEVVSNCKYNPVTGSITFNTNHFSMYAVGYNKVTFKDVAIDAWYSKAVGFIAARDITAGTGNDNYRPEAKLTRGEFLVMLMRAYGIAPDANPKNNFADAGDTYRTGYLAAAKRIGISEGVGNNLFTPDKEITRQEMFTLLYNALKVIGKLPEENSGKQLSSFSDAGQTASWAKDAMELFVQTGIISGSEGKLTPTDTTARAELAQVLYNLLSE